MFCGKRRREAPGVVVEGEEGKLSLCGVKAEAGLRTVVCFFGGVVG